MRDRRSLVLALVVGYGAFYLCRANVEAAFPLLGREYGFTKSQLGYMSTIPIVAYAIGKFVTGGAGDVIGGRRLLLVAAIGSICATIAFGAAKGLPAFVVCATINRFFQSGGWSGTVSVVAHRFERSRHGAVMGVVSTSYELGNVAATLFCSAVTRAFSGWRPLFLVNPALFAAVTLFASFGIRAASTSRNDLEPHAPHSEPEPTLAREAPIEVVLALARKPAFWLAVLLSVLLTFLRVGFLTWTPTYLFELSRETGGHVVSEAIAKSAIFSGAGVVAALVVGALSDRLGPGRRAPVMAASLSVVVALVLVLAHGNVRSATVAALLIGGVGLFLLGPYSLLAGALALDISGRRSTATAVGIIDGAGYLGASVAGVGLGGLAERWGWSAAFDAIAAAALLATVVTGIWSWAVFARPIGARRPAT